MAKKETTKSLGDEMYARCHDLFPICRSITGNGVRETLKYLKKILSDINIHEVPSGTKAFDWNVPNEWNINDAYVADESGNRIIDFKKNNLHIVGYSEPVDNILTLEELQKHLYSLPDQPDAIPYITSYYERRWGFCLSENQRKQLKQQKYRVKIDSTLEPGHLTYGEIILPGKSEREILLSTYICHPSMANNELSGPVVTLALAQWLSSLSKRKYTYRIVFVPETIGSIVYLSRHLEKMKKNTVAGYVITCIGDNRSYSYLASRGGNTLSDRVARHVLSYHDSNYKSYSYLERGSDERQFCSAGINLPVCSIMRTKYGCYPEYHTSLDDMSFISPDGLEGGYQVIKKCLQVLEANEVYKMKVNCEPQLGKRGLFPTIGTKKTTKNICDMMNFIAYADGSNDLLSIAEKTNVYAGDLIPVIKKLKNTDLV